MAESETPRTDRLWLGLQQASEFYRAVKMQSLAIDLERELHLKDQKIAELEQESKAHFNQQANCFLYQKHGENNGSKCSALEAAEAHAEALQAKVAELERERSALMPQPCCQDYDNCTTRCEPKAREFRARAESLQAKVAEIEPGVVEMTKIEWTDETWNPVTGCTKVSQGCKHCYAERIWPKVEAAERQREHWDWMKAPKRVFTDVLTHPERLDAPLHWKKPRRIFVNSMSDLFHEDVPFDFVSDVWLTMIQSERHTFQILTKRPARMLEFFKERHVVTARTLPNVWLGVSVEDQATADERIPLLLQTPAAVRFISAEPLLGQIDIDKFVGEGFCEKREDNTHCVHWWDGDGEPCCACRQYAPLSWVIAGGESGPKARPSHPDWFRSLRNQCAAAAVPYFFKQWGEWQIASAENGHHDSDMARNNAHWVHIDGVITKPSCLRKGVPDKVVNQAIGMFRMGKKSAGRLLDGREHSEYPA